MVLLFSIRYKCKKVLNVRVLCSNTIVVTKEQSHG